MRLSLRSLFWIAPFQISALIMSATGEQSLAITSNAIPITITDTGIGVDGVYVPDALYRLETQPYLSIQVLTLKDALNSANGRIEALEASLDASENVGSGWQKLYKDQQEENKRKTIQVIVISGGIAGGACLIGGFILGILVAK